MTGKARLILLSFLMLFAELALIRWLGSNVIYLAYFSNFVLLGSFLGIGLGFLRAKASGDLFGWAIVTLAFLIAFVLIFPVQIDRSGLDDLWGHTGGIPMWIALPVIFLAVTLVMASIAQGVARAFAAFEPLEAYRLDIIGSLAGIVAFSALSFLGAPPVLWGAVASAAFLVLYFPAIKLVQVAAAVAVLVALGNESMIGQKNIDPQFSWSPYYKIAVASLNPTAYARNGFIHSNAKVLILNVNGIPHQNIMSIAARKIFQPLYFVPYQRLMSNPLGNVLIIGAGNGGDVAIALAAGAKHVDAVEIDPRIYQIGRQINPDHAYQDPRVTVHIDDGRAFLEQTPNHYDLILFALPDSLVMVSGQSSLRLETYLFTLESIRAARAHLNPGGAFGMYNNYRQEWLVDRLARTLEVAYGHPPCVDEAGGNSALLMIGLEARGVACAVTWNAGTRTVPEPVSDDRPFLYLETRSLPALYIVTLAMILLASLLMVRAAGGPLREMSGYLDLFFMGAAFLLLETKNIVQFALLFGTTWFVNALVFFGILVSVLAAIELAKRVRIRRMGIAYIALFATLALAWAIKPELLLPLSFPLRLAAAAALAFAPIFLANLVFAERFRDVGSSTTAFAANLLGAMAGGVLEYSSLIFGYRGLLAVVAVFYAVAFLLGRKHLELPTGRSASL
jgi:hypothetical protein